MTQHIGFHFTTDGAGAATVHEPWDGGHVITFSLSAKTDPAEAGGLAFDLFAEAAEGGALGGQIEREVGSREFNPGDTDGEFSGANCYPRGRLRLEVTGGDPETTYQVNVWSRP